MIVEDDVLIVGNCGVYEGTIIKQGAVLGTGTLLNASTPVYDIVKSLVYSAGAGGPLIIPERAVIVPGSRSISKGPLSAGGSPFMFRSSSNTGMPRRTRESNLRIFCGNSYRIKAEEPHNCRTINSTGRRICREGKAGFSIRSCMVRTAICPISRHGCRIVVRGPVSRLAYFTSSNPITPISSGKRGAAVRSFEQITTSGGSRSARAPSFQGTRMEWVLRLLTRRAPATLCFLASVDPPAGRWQRVLRRSRHAGPCNPTSHFFV